MEDDVWGGVPPVGSKTINNKWTHMLGLLGIILVEWVLWLIYRYLSLPIIETAFSKLGFIFHIIAAPTIGLLPIVFYWRVIKKEKGLPWKFTRKNLFTSVTIGAFAATLLMLLYQLASFLILTISGYAIPTTIEMISIWRTAFANGEVDWFILMTFTFFFIVGPVEELQYRSFLQDQIGRAFKPSTGLLLASTLFALSHLPIYFLVYRLSPLAALFTLCWTFTMGSVLGVFYFQSRNIWGPIIMHGFWDWVLSVWILDYRLKLGYFEIGELQSVLWLLALIPMALLTMYLINFAYSAFWKEDRPDGSFGIGPIRPLSNLADNVGKAISRKKLAKLFKRTDSSMIPFSKRLTRSTLSVVIIAGLTMLLTAPGTVVLVGNMTQNNNSYDLEELGKNTFSYVDSIYVPEGDTQHLNVNINDTWLISSIKITVFWVDENPAGPRFTNLPDTFSGVLEIAELEEISLEQTDSGSLVFVWDSDIMNITNRDAAIHITCVEAGDQIPVFDVIGARRRADNGNDVTVSVQIEYYETESLFE